MDEPSSPNGRSPWGRTQAGQLRAEQRHQISHTGGTVTVNVTRVGEKILPKMIDADVGMEPGILARTRAGHLVESTEGTEHKAGSGLGLAICRDILETHGGRLQLESEPGRDGNERLSLEIDPVDRADRRIARWR